MSIRAQPPCSEPQLHKAGWGLATEGSGASFSWTRPSTQVPGSGEQKGLGLEPDLRVARELPIAKSWSCGFSTLGPDFSSAAYRLCDLG